MKSQSFMRAFWRHSIGRQLALGFALSTLTLLLGYGFVIYKQQQDELYRSVTDRAISFARSLSISGTSWVLASDLVGLQELVHGFVKVSDMRRAYFLSPQGEVLASTSPNEIGFFVTDPISREMLSSDAKDRLVLADQHNLVDVAYPVIYSGNRLGWVRVELSRDNANAHLEQLTRNWLEFALLTVLIVVLVALFLARRLTQGLRHLMFIATEIERGEDGRRSDVGRADEIGILARHLDRMLDAIKAQKEQLRASEAKYRFLADNISDVIWVFNLENLHWEYVSPSVVKLTGYSVEAMQARSMEQMLTSASWMIATRLIEERSRIFLGDVKDDHVYSDEMEIVCRNGSVVWAEITTHFTRNERGEMILLGVSRDISERKKAEEQIRNLAFYDALTQLPNRRLLLDRFGLVMSSCKRNKRYAALMFMDLDNFKPLNDEYGHDAGDLLLIEVAKRIAACVREVDTVARFGGDEFVVILNGLDSDYAASMTHAGTVAEKVLHSLAEPYRLALEGNANVVEHRCTASIGMVLFNQESSSEEELLRLADHAMYQAKELGRNQVSILNALDAQ